MAPTQNNNPDGETGKQGEHGGMGGMGDVGEETWRKRDMVNSYAYRYSWWVGFCG